MVSAIKSFLAVAIIASVACSAYAIQCFVCDSGRDLQCGEKFEEKNHFKMDCSQLAGPRNPQYGSYQSYQPRWNATGCMKRLYDRVPGQHIIERSCFFGDISHTSTGCQSLPVDYNQQPRLLSCDVCSGNLCNGSSSLTPIGIAIMLFFALARVFA